MDKKSHCCQNKHLGPLTSDKMIHPIPLKDLNSCKIKSKSYLNKSNKDGSFIDYNNTSFSNQTPVAYGEEADSDDL